MEEKLILNPRAKMKITSLLPDFIHVNAMDKEGTSTKKMVVRVSGIVKAVESGVDENWTNLYLLTSGGSELVICKNQISEFIAKLIQAPTFISTYENEQDPSDLAEGKKSRRNGSSKTGKNKTGKNK